MKKNKVSLNLEDLRVESFETLPELSDEQTGAILGDAAVCYPLCGTGGDTVVCCYPTQGNGSGRGGGGGNPGLCSLAQCSALA